MEGWNGVYMGGVLSQEDAFDVGSARSEHDMGWRAFYDFVGTGVLDFLLPSFWTYSSETDWLLISGGYRCFGFVWASTCADARDYSICF